MYILRAGNPRASGGLQAHDRGYWPGTPTGCGLMNFAAISFRMFVRFFVRLSSVNVFTWLAFLGAWLVFEGGRTSVFIPMPCTTLQCEREVEKM